MTDAGIRGAWARLQAGDRAGGRAGFRAALGTDEDRAARVALAMTAQTPPEQAEALGLLQQGLARHPGHGPLWEELVALLLRAGRPQRAEALCLQCIPRMPGRGRLWTLLGRSLARQGRHREAIEAWTTAERLLPDNAFNPAAIADAHVALGAPGPAVAALDRAIALAPDRPSLRVKRAKQLLLQRDLVGAAAGLRAALLRGAPVEELACLALIPLRNVADWRDHDRLQDIALGQIHAALDAGARSPLPPGQFLACFDDGRLHRRIAASWCPPVQGPRPPARPVAGRPLRVGYLSADYRNHAMGHLTGGVLAGHDPAQVEVFALSRTPEAPGDRVQAAIRGAVPRWIDLRGCDTAALVDRVRALELDVLVDLMGHTEGHALAACARGLAPVQLTWLGYPGTTGGQIFDHVVVDAETGADAAAFSEQRLVLPTSYQPPNPAWTAAPVPDRAQLGLPADALVLGSFCQAYKLGPRLFAAWMGLLRRHPRAVLWQIARPDATRVQLRRAVAAAGVDPARLIFAGYVDHASHLARLSQVDLGLDSLSWGAHTTARELLWAGVPFVTCRGDQMSARVGAGLLRAAGLSALICPDLGAAMALADALLTDAPRRAALRERVGALRAHHPLFSLPAFLRAWEAGLRAVATDAAAGVAPRALSVAADGTVAPC